MFSFSISFLILLLLIIFLSLCFFPFPFALDPWQLPHVSILQVCCVSFFEASFRIEQSALHPPRQRTCFVLLHLHLCFLSPLFRNKARSLQQLFAFTTEVLLRFGDFDDQVTWRRMIQW